MIFSIGIGMRRIGFLSVIALVGALADAGNVEAQDVGIDLGTVPEAVQLEDLDGKAVDLSQYVGRKPVLIEFWATWCPLCAELEPKLKAAKQKYGASLEVLVVAVGVNQTTRSIKRHVADHPLPGPVLFDARGRATRAYMAPSTSYIVALDGRGRVVYTGVGADQDIGKAAALAVGR